jgi:CDP-paratose 2-epimerase
MSVAVISGSTGLVGCEAVIYFAAQGMDVVGIDNGMGEDFFGASASSVWRRNRLAAEVPRSTHYAADTRDYPAISRIFARYNKDIALVVHSPAETSHGWATGDPLTNFSVNASGTAVMLEATRNFAPNAVFVFTSTNRVYGDAANALPFVETGTRWEIESSHPYAKHGIPESMSVDQSQHGFFGASKLAADILVQAYGSSFGIRTACFRSGCVSGSSPSGTQPRSFLSELMQCTVTGEPYTVFGYGAKQVRDHIHSADVIRAFDEFFRSAGCGEVYNMGGGRRSNCSMLEAIELCQRIAGKQLRWEYAEPNSRSELKWWISDVSRFRQRNPEWRQAYDVPLILSEIYECNGARWLRTAAGAVSVPAPAAWQPPLAGKSLKPNT